MTNHILALASAAALVLGLALPASLHHDSSTAPTVAGTERVVASPELRSGSTSDPGTGAGHGRGHGMSAGRSAGTSYRWPTGAPVAVLRPFDEPAQRWLAGHRGVDLALAPGGPVLAAAPGVVVFAGSVAGRPVVSVLHADGIRTTYEPVEPVVATGDAVAGGDLLGRLTEGGWHCGPTPCLHWGARRAPDAYVDPLALVRRAVVVRLFPSAGA